MAQLTQGQNQLNQAMAEAMSQQLQINRNVERSVEYKDRSELKGIPKPDKFTGASGTWDSKWYKFKTWAESCHKNAVKIVAQVEAQCDKSQALKLTSMMVPSLFQLRLVKPSFP